MQKKRLLVFIQLMSRKMLFFEDKITTKKILNNQSTAFDDDKITT